MGAWKEHVGFRASKPGLKLFLWVKKSLNLSEP